MGQKKEYVFSIADIAILVGSEMTIKDDTFALKLRPFRTDNLSTDLLCVMHHTGYATDFILPQTQCVYDMPPWKIYRNGDNITYCEGYSPTGDYIGLLKAVWSNDYRNGHIFHPSPKKWLNGNIEALTAMTTDQILVASLLSDRNGFLLHSGGMKLWDKGFVFIGASDAGKSTTVEMLQQHGEILCDDRIAVRNIDGEQRIYGTWFHGTCPQVSPASAPLRALCFIEQSDRNEAILITDRQEILRRLLPRIVKPLADAEWWAKTLATVDELIRTVPAYVLRRDLSGKVVDVLRNL